MIFFIRFFLLEILDLLIVRVFHVCRKICLVFDISTVLIIVLLGIFFVSLIFISVWFLKNKLWRIPTSLLLVIKLILRGLFIKSVCILYANRHRCWFCLLAWWNWFWYKHVLWWTKNFSVIVSYRCRGSCRG